jgi:hypothetical protein
MFPLELKIGAAVLAAARLLVEPRSDSPPSRSRWVVVLKALSACYGSPDLGRIEFAESDTRDLSPIRDAQLNQIAEKVEPLVFRPPGVLRSVVRGITHSPLKSRERTSGDLFDCGQNALDESLYLSALVCDLLPDSSEISDSSRELLDGVFG